MPVLNPDEYVTTAQEFEAILAMVRDQIAAAVSR